MMVVIGATVRVMEPFAESFPGEYVVVAGDETAFYLEGIESAFDAQYLEAVR